MKKFIYGALVAGAAFTACSDDTMDRINKDNGHATVDAVPAFMQITDAIVSTGFSTVSGDYSFYLSSLTEQECGTGNNQLMKAELRNSSEWANSTTFNNVWNSTYGNLMNIEQMIQKSDADGDAALVGMGQVLKVLNVQILTDMHGDIPYSEALQGSNNTQPKADSQESIYASLLETIDAAIENLSGNPAVSSNLEKQDIAFGGNVESWLATAYALKARLLLHKTALDAANFALAKEAAQKAVENGFEGFLVDGFNGVTMDNPWSAYEWSREYVNSSATVGNMMEAFNDPRVVVYSYTGDYATPGDGEYAKESASVDFPQWLDLGSQPIHLFSKHELYFILAECQLRAGEDATEAFKTAVSSSIDEVGSWFGEDFDGVAYADSMSAYLDLDLCMQEKYLAMCVDEQVETYNDIRRAKAMGEEFITLTNPNNMQGTINRFPYVLPYGNSDVISNKNITALFGDGFYVYEKKCWLYNK